MYLPIYTYIDTIHSHTQHIHTYLHTRWIPGSGSRQVVTLTELCEKLSKELSEADRLAEQDLNDISYCHKSELQTLDAKVIYMLHYILYYVL